MKNIIYWLLGLVVVLLGVAMVGKNKGWFGPKDEGTKVAVELATVKEIIGTVSATGKIYPENEVKISPDVSGEVVELLVEEGDNVVKGQVLAKIFAEDYQTVIDKSLSVLNNSKAGVAQASAGIAQAEAGVAQAKSSVLQAQANVGQAKATLAQAKSSVEQSKGQFAQAQAREQQALNVWNNAKAEYERNQRLFNEELISQKELAASELQVNSSQADYRSSQQAVSVAQQQIKSAEEQVRSAEQGIKSAEQSVTSAQEQVKSQLQTVESARASKQASEYNVQSVQSDVARAKTDLQKTIIRAPRSGIISKMSIEKGERVVGTSQMAGTELMIISNLDNMECRVEVSEIDIARINYGDECTIEVDSYPGKKFTGKVTKISNSNNSGVQVTNDQVTNYLVTVNINSDSYKDLQDKKFPFRPGMSASVDVLTEKEDNKIAIPIQAVTALTEKKFKKLKKDSTSVDADDKELLEFVYVVRNGEADIVPVKSGFQDSDNIVIESGLSKKDTIIVAPYNVINKGLKKGESVTITEKSKLYETNKK